MPAGVKARGANPPCTPRSADLAAEVAPPLSDVISSPERPPRPSRMSALERARVQGVVGADRSAAAPTQFCFELVGNASRLHIAVQRPSTPLCCKYAQLLVG